jgi:putative endonuclease
MRRPAAKAKATVKGRRKSKPATKNTAPKRKSDCFVYVLGCIAKGRHWTYVGWTNDLDKRLSRHNSGKGARSTRGRIWTLLHSERLRTREAAMSREWNLKRDRKFRKSLAQRMLNDAVCGQ